MSSIYALKGRFQDLLRPLVRSVHRMGVTANQVTIAAALFSLVIAAWVYVRAGDHPWIFLALPLWMFARMAMNAMDGMLAREFGQQSRLGAYLNELCDVAADSALYLSLLALHGLAVWPVVLFALLAVIAEYAGVLGVTVGAQRRYDGPMGKSDRAFVVGVLGILLAFSWIAAAAVKWVLLAACILLLVTLWRRVANGLGQGDPK